MHITIKKKILTEDDQARANISKTQLAIIQCKLLRITQNEGSEHNNLSEKI